MQVSNPGLSEFVLPLVDGDSVLDFGCGAGLYGFLLKYSWYRTKAKKPFKQVDGIDSSHDTVNNVTKMGFYNKVYLGNDLKLPIPDNSYDTVICLECVEHLYKEDVPFLVSELLRVCKKNLIISTPPHNLVSNESWCNKEIENLKNSNAMQKLNYNEFHNLLGELHKCYVDAGEFLRCGFKTYMEQVKDNNFSVKLINETNVYFGEKNKVNLDLFKVTCGANKKFFGTDQKEDYTNDYISALLDQAGLAKMIEELKKVK